MTAQEKLLEIAKKLNLTESSNQNSTEEDILWEYLVGLFLYEHSYNPQRIQKRRDKKDLDFSFKINNFEMYAECTCVSDGKAAHLAIASKTDATGHLPEYINTSVEEINNNIGVRITSSVTTKQDQIKVFHEQTECGPTFLFLNSGQLSNMPSISDVNSLIILGSCVSALYGLDGVPTFELSGTKQIFTGQMACSDKNGYRSPSPNPVNRMGFRDGTFENISAAVHSNEKPSQLADWLFTNYGGDAKALFSHHAEIIVNASALDKVALDQISQFYGLRTIFIRTEGIVINQNIQRLCRVSI